MKAVKVEIFEKLNTKNDKFKKNKKSFKKD
jgi:hypothetical protein